MFINKFKTKLSIVVSMALFSTMAPQGTIFPEKAAIISSISKADTTTLTEETVTADYIQASDATTVSPCALSINMNLSTSQATITKPGGMVIDDVFYYQIVVDKKNVPQQPSSKKWVTAVVDKLQNSNGTNAYLLDFSWLTYGKSQTLYVTTDIDTSAVAPISFHISTQVKALKFKLENIKPSTGISNQDYLGTDVSGYLVIDKSKTDGTIKDFRDLEWKTNDGNWQKVILNSTPTLNLNDYVNEGAVLNFRKSATETEPFSKTVKFKLSSKATGPKISINTTDKTVTFPAGCEYILGTDYANEATWTKVSTLTTKPFSEIATITENSDVYLHVRTSPTDRKPASKSTIVTLSSSQKADTSIDTSTLIKKFTEQKIYIPFNQNNIIYYSFANAEKEPRAWNNLYKVDSYNNVDGAVNTPCALLDLSTLNPGKDNWIYLKGDYDTKATFIKLEKAPTLRAQFVPSFDTLSITQKLFVNPFTNFTAETGYYCFTIDNLTMTSGKNILWKTENGSWSYLSTLHLENFKYKGTKIYFMLASDETLCSKAIKFSHPAKAKGVSVKLDGSKLTVKLNKKLEYRVKVEDGSYGSWTSVTAPKSSVTISLGSLEGMTGNGNGISTQWKDTTLMIRTAATTKKVPSNISVLPIYAPEEPTCGSEGFAMQYITAGNPKSGMKFTNTTDVNYQVAIIEGDTNPQAAIDSLNYTAKSKQAGYVKFKTVKAKKTLNISYSQYKSFSNPLPICRIASIKENQKTLATEFRIASIVTSVTGSTPQCSLASGLYAISGESNSETVPVTFSITDGWTVYYTTGDTAPKVTGTTVSGTKYTDAFNVTITKGETISIHAIGVKLDSNNNVIKIGGTLSVVVTGYKAGDKSVYQNRWGYKLCLSEDSKNNSSVASNLYTMAYDAIATQASETDISALGISKDNRAFIKMIVERVRYDNPQLLQFAGDYSFTYNSSIMLSLKPEYKQNAATTASMLSEVEETYQKIVALAKSNKYGNNNDLSQIADVQKVKAIHDYLILNNQYKKSSHDQDIYGAMSTKSSPVCMSYAMSFLYCCQRMDIECVLVVGYAGEAHAWNMLKLENSDGEINSDDWYEMDVTWDDPVGDNVPIDYIGTDCFNVTTSFLSTHIKNRKKYTDVYTSYPVNEATGTDFNAQSVYTYSSALYYSNTNIGTNYGCGLKLPDITGIQVH